MSPHHNGNHLSDQISEQERDTNTVLLPLLVKTDGLPMILNEYSDADPCSSVEGPLWEAAGRGEGLYTCTGRGLHYSAALLTGSRPSLCPHIPPTDVWQGKYFHSWRAKGGKIYVLRYIMLEVVKKEEKFHAGFFFLSLSLSWTVSNYI